MIRVLQLTKKFPWPLNDGELIAIYTMASGLKHNQVALDLLAMNTSKHLYNGPIPEQLKQIYDELHSVVVDNHPKALPALLNLFSGKSYHIERFVSIPFQEALVQQLQSNQYHAVLLETVYLAPYIPVIRAMQPQTKIILRAHNVEHQIWERLKSNTRSPLKKIYLQVQIARLKKFELESLQKIDLLCPISQQDALEFQALGYQKACTVIETGLNLEEYNYKAPIIQQPIRCAFIGSLDWPPNQEGLLWFAKNIWPAIVAKFSDAEFHIAGKNAPEGFESLFPKGFHFHGKVEDAREFIQRYPFFVVPLLSGSGIRIKILEALALGRIVLSTSVGAEGIANASKYSLFLCDHPQEFIASLEHCYNFPTEIIAQTMQYREKVATDFEFRSQAALLVQALL